MFHLLKSSITKILAKSTKEKEKEREREKEVAIY
jgi:helix-turn-helix protein